VRPWDSSNRATSWISARAQRVRARARATSDGRNEITERDVHLSLILQVVSPSYPILLSALLPSAWPGFQLLESRTL